jgi:hypothetical protein
MAGGRLRPCYQVVCDCGKEQVVLKQGLAYGYTTSCGCSRGEASKRTWEKRKARDLCQRINCNEQIYSSVKMRFCVKHYRFNSMRSRAMNSGKYAPSFEELENLIPKDFVCIGCGRKMVWLQKDDPSAVVSLQHDRDGTLRFICLACNSRHARFDGDTFYELPEGMKRCALCGKNKPLEEFVQRRDGWLGKTTRCKPCHNEYGKKYR